MYESYLNCPRGWKSLLILQRNCSHLKRILPDFIMVLLEYFPLTGEGLNFFSILAIEWIINKNIRMCQMHFDSVFLFGILDKYHKLSIYKLLRLLWNNIHEVPRSYLELCKMILFDALSTLKLCWSCFWSFWRRQLRTFLKIFPIYDWVFSFGGNSSFHKIQ